MYVKKQLHVETAGLMGAFGPAGGALEQGTSREKPIEGALGGAGGAAAGGAIGTGVGTAAGTAAGGLMTALTGGLAAPLAVAAPAIGGTLGGLAGSSMGADAGGAMLGGKEKSASADMGEVAPLQGDVCEQFLNKHSSTAEAVQEYSEQPVLPPAEGPDKGAKLVTSTQCNTR